MTGSRSNRWIQSDFDNLGVDNPHFAMDEDVPGEEDILGPAMDGLCMAHLCLNDVNGLLREERVTNLVEYGFASEDIEMPNPSSFALGTGEFPISDRGHEQLGKFCSAPAVSSSSYWLAGVGSFIVTIRKLGFIKDTGKSVGLLSDFASVDNRSFSTIGTGTILDGKMRFSNEEIPEPVVCMESVCKNAKVNSYVAVKDETQLSRIHYSRSVWKALFENNRCLDNGFKAPFNPSIRRRLFVGFTVKNSRDITFSWYSSNRQHVMEICKIRVVDGGSGKEDLGSIYH